MNSSSSKAETSIKNNDEGSDLNQDLDGNADNKAADNWKRSTPLFSSNSKGSSYSELYEEGEVQVSTVPPTLPVLTETSLCIWRVEVKGLGNVTGSIRRAERPYSMRS